MRSAAAWLSTHEKNGRRRNRARVASDVAMQFQRFDAMCDVPRGFARATLSSFFPFASVLYFGKEKVGQILRGIFPCVSSSRRFASFAAHTRGAERGR